MGKSYIWEVPPGSVSGTDGNTVTGGDLLHGEGVYRGDGALDGVLFIE